MIVPFTGVKNQPNESRANEFVEAAQGLYHKLWHGHTGDGKTKVPIAGDTRRLPYANGMTALEKRLAWNMQFVAQNLPGVQQSRQTMGHHQFGARVVYGDCIFLTISPNEQHSSLVLRLSRYRRNDPFLKGDDEVQQAIQRNAGRDAPRLEVSARRPEEEVESCDVELPTYELRRIIATRDPLAVIDAHDLNIRLRLARIMGVRMCPTCPRCNDTNRPCQNKFGSNMLPQGGFCGLCPALTLASEHQGLGTPHGHGQAHIVCVYQYGTLPETAEMIKKQTLKM